MYTYSLYLYSTTLTTLLYACSKFRDWKSAPVHALEYMDISYCLLSSFICCFLFDWSVWLQSRPRRYRQIVRLTLRTNFSSDFWPTQCSFRLTVYMYAYAFGEPQLYRHSVAMRSHEWTQLHIRFQGAFTLHLHFN